MDYVDNSTKAATKRNARDRLRTGPMPTVPWRDLDRRASVDSYLPLLILLAFALLAGIQFLLQG